ncbi:MAG: LapA family protein [Candidatus Scalindua sediminis]|nr:LapA family protein [Candidatus Scalindua sediminis]
MIKDKKLIKIIIISVLAVIMVIVVFQNVAPVKIHFLFWTFTSSRYLVIFLLFSIGFITGWLLRSQSLLRKRK